MNAIQKNAFTRQSYTTERYKVMPIQYRGRPYADAGSAASEAADGTNDKPARRRMRPHGDARTATTRQPAISWCKGRSWASRMMAVLLLTAGVWANRAAAQKTCYVIDKRGEKHEGTALKVTSTAGDLELNVDGRVRLPFKAGTYRFAFVPKPDEVDNLEKAFEGGRHDAVVKVAGSMFDKVKFLGWGDWVAYLEGMSLIETGKPQEALQAFAKGVPFQAFHREKLARGTVLALLEMDAADRARPLLEKMIASPKEDDAVFAFNARARLLEKEGKRREAVLEYLKVLLFFEDGAAVGELRDQARERAVALMKEMNDGRWRRIQDIR